MYDLTPEEIETLRFAAGKSDNFLPRATTVDDLVRKGLVKRLYSGLSGLTMSVPTNLGKTVLKTLH